MDIINKLEPVEYDQTVDLVEPYTIDTPQPHADLLIRLFRQLTS
ncbi:MAG: hypothetical protein ACKPKO_62380 [Candidatus Fonsibacter sp.]